MSIPQLQKNPSEFDFYQAVYCIERQFSSEKKRWQGVGRDAFPSQELVRFKSVQHLGFPGQPINAIEITDAAEPDYDKVVMQVSFMGLTGPSGVMPQHYSEMVLQRLKLRDKTMRDFFDLFNHRLVSLYYRSWEKYRFNCQYEMSPQQDSFSQVLKTLSGCTHSPGLFYSGSYSRHVRSATQLTAVLCDLLGAKVTIAQLQGRWLALQQDERSALGCRLQPRGQLAELGSSVMLGSRVWDISSSISIEIQADNTDTKSLLPAQHKAKLLQQILKDYLPAQFKVRVTVLGEIKHFPAAQIGQQSAGLGHGSRLAVQPLRQHQQRQFSYQLAGL